MEKANQKKEARRPVLCDSTVEFHPHLNAGESRTEVRTTIIALRNSAVKRFSGPKSGSMRDRSFVGATAVGQAAVYFLHPKITEPVAL